MSLSIASRTPVARTSVSRQRTVVKCSAQQPSAITRNILAAGAAMALVMGPSISPALAFPDQAQKTQGAVEKAGADARNLGDSIKDKLSGNPIQGAADSLKSNVNLGGAKNAANQAGGSAQGAFEEAKGNATSLGDTIKAKLSGNPAQSAADSLKSNVNLGGAKNAAEQAKGSAKGAFEEAKGNATSLGDSIKSKLNVNLPSPKDVADGAADSAKDLGKDIQKEAQSRLNPAGLRVPNPGSQNPYDNKFGDAKKNTFGTPAP